MMIDNFYDKEKVFIGSVILYEEFFETNSEIDESFFDDSFHKGLWRSLVEMKDRQIPLEDVSTIAMFVSDMLERDIADDEIQDFIKVSSSNKETIDWIVESLVERKRQRTILEVAQVLGEETKSSHEMIAKLTQTLDELPQKSGLENHSNAELTKRVIQEYEDIKTGLKVYERYSTGLPDLDEALDGGITPSRVYIIGARPSQGKTSLSIQLFNDILQVAGDEYTGMFVSLEMTAEALYRKQLAMVSKIPSRDIEMAQLSTDEEAQMAEGLKTLGDEMNFSIIADGKLTPEGITGHARNWERQTGRKMLILVVDYVQKIQSQSGQDEREAINALMSHLQRYALSDNVAVVVLSQLDRSIDNRSDKRPRALADLKGSGNLEQDADVAITIYRDKFYEGDDSLDPYGAELFIVKNRWGPTADINLTWIGELTAFADKSLKEKLMDVEMGGDEF